MDVRARSNIHNMTQSSDKIKIYDYTVNRSVVPPAGDYLIL